MNEEALRKYAKEGFEGMKNCLKTYLQLFLQYLEAITS